jgi:RHS repeat-associated protein
VTYDYLVTGEMSAVRENGASSGVGVLATFEYDDLGRRKKLLRGNGTSSNYDYDPSSGALSALGLDFSGTAYDLQLGFTRNRSGQVTSNTRSNDLFSWTDHSNLNRGYTSNGLNQYSASGSVVPTYDGRGNLTSAGGLTFAYTAENQLRVFGGTNGVGYDPLGRLSFLVGNVSFLYDGSELVEERSGQSPNTVLRRYVYGPDADEPLVWYELSGTTDRRFLHADDQGSIIAWSDSGGNVIKVNSYDEYGVPKQTNQGRFGYTGQKWLPEIGVYDYKARLYSPTLGRFLQTDPIGYGDGLNSYNYVGSDPVNMTDPDGLQRTPELPITITHTRSASSGGSAPPAILSSARSAAARAEELAERIRDRNDDGDGDGKPDPEIVIIAPKPPKPPAPKPPKAPMIIRPRMTSSLGKRILCSPITGKLADAGMGLVTGGATNAGIKVANARYAAGVGGEIGAVVGRRAVLIALGPQVAIALAVGVATSFAVDYARGKVCPATGS